MIHGKRIAVVMPAYNAEKTLETVFGEIPFEFVDEVILVDDASTDSTAALSRRLGIRTTVHVQNLGYGANQKTCYRAALDTGADVIVMLHPDYQYTPKLLVAMASPVAIGVYDLVLGSRILCGGALKGGMPRYKYIANRFLTLVQNLLMQTKFSEFHTGYRAFSKEVLLVLPLGENSDDFLFDNQVLAQAVYFGHLVGEVSCPTSYFEDASSISFSRSILYGLGVLKTSIQFVLQRHRLARFGIFAADGQRLDPPAQSNPGDRLGV